MSDQHRRQFAKRLVQLSLAGNGLAATTSKGASSQSVSTALTFCAIGDTPYSSGDKDNLLATYNAATEHQCNFITHIGDFKASWESCSDASIISRVELLNQAPLPLFFVPGDNDWTDCNRSILGAEPPEERLDFLRQLTANSKFSMGQKRMPLERQSSMVSSKGLPENIRWTSKQCAFVGINLCGSFNGLDVNGIDETARLQRQELSNRWIVQAGNWAEQNQAKALVILAHANVDLEQGVESKTVSPRRSRAFTPFRRSLDQLLTQYKKPVLFIHGDTHHYQFNAPWSKHPHLRRVEVFGAPRTSSWVKVEFDPLAEKPGFSVTTQKLGPS